MTNSGFNSILVIAVMGILGFCLIVGVITVMRWPWQRHRALPGGVEQMIYQLGPLSGPQLEAVYFAILAAINSKGHATWDDAQTAVANARASYPAARR